MRVLVGCVAENNDKFLSQALRLLLSLRWFGGRLAEADVLVCVVDDLHEVYAAEFARLGALTRIVSRVDPLFPPGNKLRFFEQPEVNAYDSVLYLDCDTVIVQDPSPYLSPTELCAKIVDGPTVTMPMFARLCRHFGLTLPAPTYRTTVTGTPTIWYCNSGALNLPVKLIPEIVPLWLDYQSQLSGRPALLPDQFHCGQAGLALAYLTRPVPFREWPAIMNFPLHQTHLEAPPELLAGDPVVLHYHSLVDEAGHLRRTPYPLAQQRIQQFNQRLAQLEKSGWHFPRVEPAAAREGTAAAVTLSRPQVAGAVLVEAGAEAHCLRDRLEDLLGRPEAAATQFVVLADESHLPDVQSIAASLQPSLTVLAAGLRPTAALIRDLYEHLRSGRLAFLPVGGAYSPPNWERVPLTGEAVMPWLPGDMPAANDMQVRPIESPGWLASIDFVSVLPEVVDLKSWRLFTLAEQPGLARRPLHWRSAPAARLPAGATPVWGPPPLTRQSSILAIVPHYRTEAWLAQCLQSLVDQTRPPEAIVVVADGPDEASENIVRQFPGVTLLASPENVGVFRVMQSLFDTAGYDGYLLQDADDFAPIDRLEILLAEAERTGAELVGSPEVRLVTETREVQVSGFPLDVNQALAEKPAGLPLLLNRGLISRALLQRLGGLATGLQLTADSELTWRAGSAARIVNVPYYSYFRRKRPGAMTTSPATDQFAPQRVKERTAIEDRAQQNAAALSRGEMPRLEPYTTAGHVRLVQVRGPELAAVDGHPVAQAAAPPVCIAGMHRSGTSMFAKLLHLCGVYLGPENELSGGAPDNPDGFWENLQFRTVNVAVLAQFQGGWDLPPLMPDGWQSDPVLAPVRAQAEALIQAFDHQPLWGWKDPRNSLTLPFWQTLRPDLRVVICLRHPLEVAQSLRRRGYSSMQFGFQLWETYNRRLLAAVGPERRVITHFDAYFHNPEAELQRVLRALEIPTPAVVIERAVQASKPALRHQYAARLDTAGQGLPASAQALYEQMCAEAGVGRHAGFVPEKEAARAADRRLQTVAIHWHAAQQALRLQALARARQAAEQQQQVAEQQQRLAELNRQLRASTAQRVALEQQIAMQQADLAALQQQLNTEHQAVITLQQQGEASRQAAVTAQAELAALRATKAVQAVSLYWRLRTWLRRR